MLIATNGDGRGDSLDQPEWAKELLFGSVFTGCVVGILCMGVVGELVRRQRGLAMTTFFTVFGLLGSAAFSWPGYGVWHIIVVCRFISGVGIGRI